MSCAQDDSGRQPAERVLTDADWCGRCTGYAVRMLAITLGQRSFRRRQRAQELGRCASVCEAWRDAIEPLVAAAACACMGISWPCVTDAAATAASAPVLCRPRTDGRARRK